MLLTSLSSLFDDIAKSNNDLTSKHWPSPIYKPWSVTAMLKCFEPSVQLFPTKTLFENVLDVGKPANVTQNDTFPSFFRSQLDSVA